MSAVTASPDLQVSPSGAGEWVSPTKRHRSSKTDSYGRAKSNGSLGSAEQRPTVSFDDGSEVSLTFELDSLQLEIVTLMRKARTRRELIYAYLRAELLATEETYGNPAPED